MIENDGTAPGFELPGVSGGQEGFERFSLTETLDTGDSVLMLFYPFDFSPVCVRQACAMREMECFQLTQDLSVWGISGDSCYVHREFADEYDLDFPLLADTAGRVAESYGVLYDEFEKHERIPKRAVVLVDSDRTVRYNWVADEATTHVDFEPVLNAVGALPGERDAVEPPKIEVDVDPGGP